MSSAGRGWSLAVALGALALVPGQARGQDLSDLFSSCGVTSPAHLSWCRETALAAQAAQGALGLAASGGIDLPGSASTLGWRTKGSPRFALSFWGSLTRAPFPAMTVEDGSPRGETTATLPALHLSATAGLFDGFSLGPTVGGFGSIDLSVTSQYIWTPKDRGFNDHGIGWGAGARIGILRESFSLPGLSISGFHRFGGSHELWDVAAGDPSAATFDLETSSLRGLLGKDLWGVGLTVGVGWDRYGGEVAVNILDPQGGGSDDSGEGRLESERYLGFLGASRTFLTFQVSGELGWAEGFESTLPLSGQGGFDPAGPSFFGSLALRLTF
ncbi:MAG: hypothetical protein HKO65_13725 [Gemmatimonadetes bacterium]|nr:hypothetical protein [Gemmatimonadota bacterium]